MNVILTHAVAAGIGAAAVFILSALNIIRYKK